MPGPLITCLWFDGNATEAANYYIKIFPNSKINSAQNYPESGSDKPKKELTVEFELNGHKFVGLNGGPEYKFNPAISFQVFCDDQTEVDYYWERLGEGGDEKAQVCGWVADKFGVSWQVVPKNLPKLLGGEDKERAGRAMTKMRGMKKLIIEELEKA
ncbi:hypothetical protein QQS21_010148 [Conoideocrella luteorostrata]|uniref:PhnB-like domain-containing protein n=1 Tax=Conoideocrella luteorostrata TaxID=1105319 RepID=A0AAJ0FX54_9HYPO|nr:hypothetical protein QQS21_010148 [Conoideocrella luteorostrata]